MRSQLQETLAKKTYNVHDYYSKTGVCQAICRHPIYENIRLGVVCVLLAWLAVDVDHNAAVSLKHAATIFQIVMLMFLVFFVLDVIIRFGAFERKVNACKDAHLIIDTFLTSLFLLSILVGLATDANVQWLFIFQVVRICSLARAIPELGILIKGLFDATRSMFFVVLLELLITYTFALVFVYGARDTDLSKQYFESVPTAMHTLMIHGLFFNVDDIAMEMNATRGWLEVVFIIYVVLSFTIIVITAGILCEIVCAVAATEKERMVVDYLKDSIQNKVATIFPGTEVFTQDQFQQLLLCPDVAQTMTAAGVDVVSLVDTMDPVFTANPEVPLPDLMDTILNLRESNTATVKDIVELRKAIANSSGLQLNDIRKVVKEAVEPLQKKLEATENAVKVLPFNNKQAF